MRHRLRPCAEQADDGDAGHPEQGLGDPDDGEEIDAFRVRLAEQGDDHRGEAAEHEGLRVGVAQQRAAGGAQRQPQRQGDEERYGRLAEQRGDGHRHGAGDHSADHLGEALLQRHAGQRRADDDHRHGRPLRLFEVEEEGDVQRQQPGGDGAQGEQQGVAVGSQEGAQIDE
ncbi:hypothetical protein D3C80_1525470 [compost metagenome]